MSVLVIAAAIVSSLSVYDWAAIGVVAAWFLGITYFIGRDRKDR